MSILGNAVKCKCPNCKSGNMFESNGNIFLLRSPKMFTNCQVCNYKFEKEPGFYIGAMYVSYAIGVAELVACIVVLWGILDLSVPIILTVFLTIMILSSFYNYRLSRSIWTYLFFKN